MKQTNSKDLLQSAGNPTQYLDKIYKAKESQQIDVHARVTELLCYTPETNATLRINYFSV